eukprot:1892952-Pyramimonas_sp.AAC.1
MEWQADPASRISHENRFNDFTLGMLGDLDNVDPSSPHPGCTMRLKAHETYIMSLFALHCLEKHGAGLPMWADLVASGRAILKFISTMKVQPLVVPRAKQSE